MSLGNVRNLCPNLTCLHKAGEESVSPTCGARWCTAADKGETKRVSARKDGKQPGQNCGKNHRVKRVFFNLAHSQKELLSLEKMAKNPCFVVVSARCALNHSMQKVEMLHADIFFLAVSSNGVEHTWTPQSPTSGRFNVLSIRMLRNAKNDKPLST